MPEKIILDCDPGHDDAVAIMLALASPELEVLGVTTTFGNVGLENTSRNARIVLEVIGRRAPVFAGADRPLVRDRISAENVHGRSGLDGPDLPEPSFPLEAGHAVRFIIDSVMAHPGEVTVVPVGPLTNLALALRLEPRLAQNLRRVVLMGGSLDTGNTTPSAEFNILCDPHAARVVFECGVRVAMFGLNLTHQARATPPRVERFRALGTRAGRFTADLMEFFKLAYARRYGFEGPALHDPCAVAYLVRPDLFKLRPMAVEIETTPGATFGRTVCDFWGVTGHAPNADVALEVDADAFFALLAERLSVYA